MANSTIAQLSSANPLTGTELLYIDDGTSDVKSTTALLRNYIYNSAATINATGRAILLGNSAVNLVANSSTLRIGTFSANTLVVNGTSFTTTGVVVNTTAIVATSNTILLGNTIGRFVVTANSIATQGATVNATAITPTSNTILLGNSVGQFVVTANTIGAVSVNTAGALINATAITPTSNTILLGNSIGQFVITANSITTGALTSNSLGLTPTSNTIVLGSATGRFVITANSVSTQGATINATAICPTSNTILLGNSIGRFVITANSVTTTNTGLITATTAAVNGATYLTGGTLLQWGWVAANATVGNITFPVAFPTAVFSYNATSNSTVAANLVSIIAANTTTMNVRSLSTAAASNSYWMAIGN